MWYLIWPTCEFLRFFFFSDVNCSRSYGQPKSIYVTLAKCFLHKMNSKGKGVTRRSKRNKEKNKEIADSILNHDNLSSDIPKEIKDLHVGLLVKQAKQASEKALSGGDPVKEYLCKGCKRPEAPIKRFRQNLWINCECCMGWWHLECACVTKEQAEKYEKYKIDYTCALCVIDVLPGVFVKRSELDACSSVSVDDNVFPLFVEEKQESIVTPTPSPTPTPTPHDPSSENPITQSEAGSTLAQIIVVDNIKNPKEVRSSVQIQNRLKSFEVFKDIQFAYSLPQGGVALHFKSSSEADRALENWPEFVFNAGEVPHRTKSTNPNKVSYMKNVDLSLSEFQIGEVLSQIGIKTSKIKRLHYRYGKYPMPVVQLVHPSVQDKLSALEKEIPIKFHNRNAILEPKKESVIRCYHCQRFGHIARVCSYKQRCECCSVSDHLGEVCAASEFCCANCSGKHKSSSKFCPIFLQYAGKHRSSAIF